MARQFSFGKNISPYLICEQRPTASDCVNKCSENSFDIDNDTVLYLFCFKRPKEVNTFIQQDDLFKERMGRIFEGGLRYAWAMEYDNKNAEAYNKVKVEPENAKDVIVVGAGISGLVIAYELAQIGHNVIFIIFSIQS